MTRVVGERWWERGFRLWDMAAGRGNLELALPREALPYCYVSTLLEEDARYCRTLFPEACVFQYDYLNDDVHLLDDQPRLPGVDLPVVMPDRLRRDLADPKVKWIVFVNPPYATANRADAGDGKEGVSFTRVRGLMDRDGLKEASRELFTQFLWRIAREFAGRSAYLGLFSTLKYVNAANDQGMRDKVFRFAFERGFVFSSNAFEGTGREFPVGFLVWDLGESKALEGQPITLDVLDGDAERVGVKPLPSVDRADFLSRWCPRPETDRVMPPFSGALRVAAGRVDVRDRVAPGFLCSLMVNGNDMQNRNRTALLSGPYCSAGAFSVTPDNFERAMVVHAVRRIPPATWLNNRDQWIRPSVDPLPDGFVSDCMVWNLFSNSNQTASLEGVQYKGTTYRIVNELYPYLLSDVRSWECSLSPLAESLAAARKDRFAATWLDGRELSDPARELLDAGRDVYKLFYRESAGLAWPKYNIASWDVGWYQIRMALKDKRLGADELARVAMLHDRLGATLLPRIREFGFMPATETWFTDENNN